jgi:ATP-dependent helicase/nuclease subunit B
MHLVFGLACDGRTCPDFPGEGEGSISAAGVGPSGLLDILETHLGLGGPPVSDAIRIAAYAAKLRTTLERDGSVFFAPSFERDPWATAATLLGWRDDLRAAGWGGSAVGSARPDALATVEASGPRLAGGLVDRVGAVLAALAGKPRLIVETVSCVEDPSAHPLLWRRVLKALAACGVAIAPPAAGEGSADTSDLSRVQRFLAGEGHEPLAGDGSFCLVEGDTTLAISEAVAEWLVAGDTAALAGTVVLAPSGDTALLDQALQARGLPALGLSASSSFRGALQVLPLAFACEWAPFDPKSLLSLLMLPSTPVGRRAARHFVEALAREPGLGGEAWREAWDKVRQDLAERFAGQADAEREIAKRLSRIAEWTRFSGADRAAGMTVAQIRKVADRVGTWARRMDAGRGDPLLMALGSATSTLSAVVEVFGQAKVSAHLLDRIIAQVLASGARNPEHGATAGALRVVRDPGAIWSGVDRIVWWEFQGTGERVRPSPWSLSETAVLAQAGCVLEAQAARSARASLAAVAALRHARRQVLLVRSARSRGEETTSHPLAHQLHPLLAPAGDHLRVRAEALLTSPSATIAGRIIPRVAEAVRALPTQRGRWDLPASVAQRLDRRWESATSFGRMVDCQVRWLVYDVLRVRPGRFAEIPGPDQLVGSVAHALAQAVFAPGPISGAAEVEATVAAAFDNVVAAIAAPLLQPEHAGDLAAARRQVPAALGTLARVLRAKGVEVVGTELSRDAVIAEGYTVTGRIDLLVNHPVHGAGVVDLKWTRSVKPRREEIEKGRALQLATYGAIAEPGSSVPGAYYLLRQRRLLGPEGAYVAEEAIGTARTLDATWRDLVATWRSWRRLAEEGTALALGVEEATGHVPAGLPVEPGKKPCRYCELTGLCRVGRESRS